MSSRATATGKKLLCVNGVFSRLNSPGAAELDWFALITMLREMGYTVRVLQPIVKGQTHEAVERFYGLPELDLVTAPLSINMRNPRRLIEPAVWDGAGWMYASPEFTHILDSAIRAYAPDALIAVMSFLWGAARTARRAGLPVLLRSQNNEASHMLQENGFSLPNLVRYWGKSAGERHVARLPNAVAAITPNEAAFYRQLSPNTLIEALPLGTLPNLLRPPRPARDRSPLRAFFMGSSYNVPHNRKALAFIVREIAPLLRQRAPGAFELHILGSKAPADLVALAAPELIFDGYAADLETHLDGMDIALVPSLSGAGMQQKVFEPLCRAFPVITHERVLAGYPYQPGMDVRVGNTAADFVDHLLALRDPAEREALSRRAAATSARLFQRETLQTTLQHLLDAF
ncbi:MAG: glycosyltransferase [Anaerolineae bacterium]